MRRARNPRGGFTLLEVLAAVALLGIVYVQLANVAMQGLRGEGVARRRMAASLLADRRLAEIERDLLQGLVPTPGPPIEEEVDGFLVVLEVQPWEPPPELFAPVGEADAEDPPVSLIADREAGQPPLVVAIELTVSWEEGSDQRSVERSTFGYDLATVAALIPVADTTELPGGGDGALSLDEDSL